MTELVLSGMFIEITSQLAVDAGKAWVRNKDNLQETLKIIFHTTNILNIHLYKAFQKPILLWHKSSAFMENMSCALLILLNTPSNGQNWYVLSGLSVVILPTHLPI